MKPRIAVVDDGNRFVRWTDRDEIHRDRLPHRSVHVLLFSRDGRVLLQKRKDTKATDPGCWDVSTSGHVEEDDYPAGPDDALDEVYLRVAHREIREELGVDADLAFIAELPPEPDVHYEHLRLYRGVSDGPFVLQDDEVAEARFFAPDGPLPQPATRSLTWLAARGYLFRPEP